MGFLATFSTVAAADPDLDPKTRSMGTNWVINWWAGAFGSGHLPSAAPLPHWASSPNDTHTRGQLGEPTDSTRFPFMGLHRGPSRFGPPQWLRWNTDKGSLLKQSLQVAQATYLTLLHLNSPCILNLQSTSIEALITS
ncbi:hypothetical protein RHMOL_Rhmol01G0076700 [Rhododendron molle]|uniref:Uncharacterized protein n=1 Tax=Rhododendron molle TaxID=49168 RepID=A0ACC0PYT7_RHOML|nr:hypothetical protein RHMOL_Rhmol01G0076700 [Rhododendron molle]